MATPQAREAARRVAAARADARAAALAPVIAEIRATGITGAYAIAAALTARCSDSKGTPLLVGRNGARLA